MTFEEVYQRYHTYVLRFCCSRLGSGPDAEDVAQEVFTDFFMVWPKYSDCEAFGPMLIQRARWRMIRRWQTAQRPIHGAGRVNQLNDDLVRSRQTITDPLPSRIFARLTTLSAKRRQLITLYFFAGMTLQEIATLVGSTTSTINYQIKTSLKLLQ